MMLSKCCLTAAAVVAVLPAAAPAPTGTQLSDTPEKVMVLSRHGVRRQFPSSVHDFSKYAPGKKFATEDAEWGVDGTMGVLTQHGYDAAAKMGEYQGRFYHQRGFVIDTCADIFVYSEEDMPRDIFTAEAFFKGFAKGYGHPCQPPEPHSDFVEYLIDQGSAPRGDGCALGTEEETAGRMGQNVDEYTRLYRSELETLNDVLGCCDRSLCPNLPTGQKCTLLDMKHTWDERNWYDTYTGPVYAGKYFGEWFELTYLNGMEAAWGQLTEEQIMDLSVFVTQYREFEFDLLAARPFGSALLLHVLASLESWAGETSTATAGLAHPQSADLVYYAAHDTNLLYVAELLGLKWLSAGWQPNHTPPGGMLVFELYSMPAVHGTREWEVAAFFDVQTPSQIRKLSNLTMVNPPQRARVTIPGCSGASGGALRCPLPRFRELVLRTVQLECVMIPELKAWGVAATKETLGGGGVGPAPSGSATDIDELLEACGGVEGAAVPTEMPTLLLFGVAAGAALFGAAIAVVLVRTHASRRRPAGAKHHGISAGTSGSRAARNGGAVALSSAVTHRNGHSAGAGTEEAGLLSDDDGCT